MIRFLSQSNFQTTGVCSVSRAHDDPTNDAGDIWFSVSVFSSVVFVAPLSSSDIGTRILISNIGAIDIFDVFDCYFVLRRSEAAKNGRFLMWTY